MMCKPTKQLTIDNWHVERQGKEWMTHNKRVHPFRTILNELIKSKNYLGVK